MLQKLIILTKNIIALRFIKLNNFERLKNYLVVLFNVSHWNQMAFITFNARYQPFVFILAKKNKLILSYHFLGSSINLMSLDYLEYINIWWIVNSFQSFINFNRANYQKIVFFLNEKLGVWYFIWKLLLLVHSFCIYVYCS